MNSQKVPLHRRIVVDRSKTASHTSFYNSEIKEGVHIFASAIF